MLGCTSTMFSHHSEAMSIIDKNTKIIFFLKCNYLIQNS